jgi:hypothetical protein
VKQTTQVYPKLILTLRKKKADLAYRFLLVARLMDSDGAGHVDIESLCQQCQPIVKVQQFKKLLNRFDGILWTIASNGFLYLRSDLKIAEHYKIDSVGEMSTVLDLRAIVGITTAGYRAVIFGLFVNLYCKEKLVSRRTIQKWSGIPASTQRAYIATCIRFGLITDTNTNWLPILGTGTGDLKTLRGLREHYTKTGGQTPAAIQDRQGKYTRKNDFYLAYQLPNSYTFSHVTSKASIRAKYINRNLNRQTVSESQNRTISGNVVELYLQRKAKQAQSREYNKLRGGKLEQISNKPATQKCQFLLHGGIEFDPSGAYQ